MEQIRALTGLRGVAALWVVALHYTAGAGWTGTGFWFDLAAVGNAGVIIFFILSGYIMSHVYHLAFTAGPFANYLRFMWARFARVYPLHFATLIAWGLLIGLGLVRTGADDNSYTFVLNLLLVQAWGFIGDLSWNALAWTISVEFFCYLLFPFAAFALSRSSVATNAIVLATSLFFVASPPWDTVLHFVGLTRTNPYQYGFYAIHFGWMFLAGMALRRVVLALQSIAKPHQIVFDALMVAGLCITISVARPPLFDWQIAIGTALIIAGLSTDRGLGMLLFGNPVVFFLGEISYALYLTHGMMHGIMRKLFSVPTPVIVLSAILLSTFVYYLFERPARMMLRKLEFHDGAIHIR